MEVATLFVDRKSRRHHILHFITPSTVEGGREVEHWRGSAQSGTLRSDEKKPSFCPERVNRSEKLCRSWFLRWRTVGR